MRARRALRTRRIGHTGTLDPMATGLLVLAVGEATKLVAYLTEHDKRYLCTLQLGVATDSLDADGANTETRPVPVLDVAQVEAACGELVSRQTQVPPMVSALKRDGQRLHALARRGEHLELEPRPVVLHSVAVTRVAHDAIDLDVSCGKGFYVRALGRDLAAHLGTVGHLTALRRTHVGSDLVSNALSMDVLLAAAGGDDAARAQAAAHVVPLDQACRRMPELRLDAVGVEHVRHGRALSLEHRLGDDPSSGVAVVYEPSGAPLAIVRIADERVVVARGFALSAAAAARDPE